MSTTEVSTIAIKPTAIWVPLKIEGVLPSPYRTPKIGYTVTPIHPTFACELEGVDWGRDISPDEYKEIREVVDKVRYSGHRLRTML
jgi:hypothetical protein